MFIKTQRMYRFLYPVICLVCSFYKTTDVKNSRIFVYSSTAAKFFPIYSSEKTILYSNFPAKPLLKIKDYFNNKNFNIINRLILLFYTFIFKFWIKIEQIALSKFSKIIVISNVTKSAYYKIYGKNLIPEVFIVNCPVKQELFDYANIKNLNDTNKIRAIIVSRLYPEKTLEGIISFIAGIDSIHLTVVGDGPLLDKYKKLYGNNVLFKGFVKEEEKFTLISESDFLLLPTDQEWSLVTIEANILGTPVISISSESIKEINKIISKDESIPNLFYKDYSDIILQLSSLEGSKSILSCSKNVLSASFNPHSFIKKIIAYYP
jgi:hypothetical protein